MKTALECTQYDELSRLAAYYYCAPYSYEHPLVTAL
eukprot:XP_001706343.1 Hypothetical protein GL50803_27136 [Giardia lamblia ATCC 50803]